ncbi:uncharacterized protein CC84DRAFT_1205641 [Paraphaeosphaeria sporulosa]|uniref:Uncharacterized protein n=1 Tax=Paraphaeosphaeria sporulosa TaxID=1460663 RepID=A0A177CGD4_9PLEO|nr:uncharacterized protein CC84DRAFT_1205641 [Paraphaeosphaeria sporulosa]OAG06002.1 hypothetical protein CC84DRAFT_1205641 [Paraphaeosphaeria sporulosa]
MSPLDISDSEKGMSVEILTRNLRFPNANVTAIELLTFLPGCLNSPDIVYRFASNGISLDAILSIVNTNRMLEQQWTAEYCYRTVRNAMRHAGHSDWTLKKHLQYFADKLRGWNATSLSVSGFRASLSISDKRKPDADVRFARLADGVKHMPDGDDALDLTRMIQHCVQNPSEEWLYPSNYDMLLAHLGGPTHPVAANMDRPIFERWEHVIPHVPRRNRPSELTTQPKKRGRSGTPQTDGEAPRRSGRRGRPSLKRRELQEDFLGADDSGIEDQVEEFVPPSTPWVKPPVIGRAAMSFQALLYDFSAQPSPKTDDTFDAYAFGYGPRTMAPFRPLHLITIKSLKFEDLSCWAENLRWAAEQHTTFGETGWTECPEHMERIAQFRCEQTWASAELVISIEDHQQEEEEDAAWLEAMIEGTLASMRRRDVDPHISIQGDIDEEYFDAEGRLKFRPRP